MENRYFIITPEERQIVQARTEEIVSAMQEESPVKEQLQAYAVENGFTEEDARYLITEEIIPAVNQYNTSCREASQQGCSEWVKERISERTEGMSLAEEVQYKLSFLQAVHQMDQAILRQEELLEGQSWESYYEELNAELEEFPKDTEVTEELLEQVNEALAEAVENSQAALHHTATFSRLMDGKLDEETVRTAMFELWQDEAYKYCAATAACVAHQKGELPSIPEETSKYVIALGVCQGVDVEQVEHKVALGEMTADAAFEVLRIAGAVALVLLGCFLFLNILTAAVVGGELLHLMMGGGVLALLAAAGVAYCTVCGALDAGLEIYARFVGFVYRKSEVAYRTLKKGAKQLHQQVLAKILPCIQECCNRAVQFFRDAVKWVHKRTERLVVRTSRT